MLAEYDLTYATHGFISVLLIVVLLISHAVRDFDWCETANEKLL